MKFLTALSLFALLAVPAARAQNGCYGGSFGQTNAYAVVQQQPAFMLQAVQCGVQTQTVQTYATVQVPVAVQVQTVAYAAPQAVCQQTLAVPHCGVQSLGFSGGYSAGFANRGVILNNGFNRNAVFGGGGISVSAQDRRGTQVIANGNNSVRIRRDLLGRIKGADADRPRGLFPF